MTPTVSVVVPLHDASSTIDETLAAVAAQDLADWELLVVDDASRDDGPARVEAFAASVDRPVRLLVAEGAAPRGPSAARNRGLAQATGAHVAFLDADDVWDPTFLARRVTALDADPELGLVWGPARYWYPDGSAEDFDQPNGFAGQDRRFEPGGPIGEWLRDLRVTPCPSATVFRRAAIDGTGAFPEALRRGEDIAACLLVAADHPTRHDPGIVVRYRRHAASATAAATVLDRADADLAFGTWALRWARSRPDLGVTGVAARNLHDLVHRRVADRGPVAARREVTRRVLAAAPERRWALALDWVLPFRWSRRVAARLEGAIGHDRE